MCWILLSLLKFLLGFNTTVLNTIVVARIIIIILFFLALQLSHQNSETMRHTKSKLLMMIKHIKVLCKITFWTSSLHYYLWYFHIRKNMWTAVSQSVLDMQHSPWNMIYLGSWANFFLLWPKRSAWLINELSP